TRRARQPVECDVVGDVIWRQALSLPVKDACDEFVTSNVVVYHPRREADRRILKRVQRLRPVIHLLRVAEAIFKKKSSWSYACLSSAESPDGGEPLTCNALKISGGTAEGIFRWMPSTSEGARTAICSVTGSPQSPPEATNRVYPRRFISTVQARAMRTGSQPSSVGFPEKP